MQQPQALPNPPRPHPLLLSLSVTALGGTWAPRCFSKAVSWALTLCLSPLVPMAPSFTSSRSLQGHLCAASPTTSLLVALPSFNFPPQIHHWRLLCFIHVLIVHLVSPTGLAAPSGQGLLSVLFTIVSPSLTGWVDGGPGPRPTLAGLGEVMGSVVSGDISHTLKRGMRKD